MVEGLGLATIPAAGVGETSVSAAGATGGHLGENAPAQVEGVEQGKSSTSSTKDKDSDTQPFVFSQGFPLSQQS